MDPVREGRDNATKQLQSAADTAADYLDDGLASATHAAKQSVAVVRANAEQAMDVGQSYWETGVAHFQRLREHVFDKVKEGIHVANEHEEIAYPAVAVALTLTLPVTRRFLWRQTIGRFRSEESLYRSAESQYAVLSDTLEGATAEGEKLAARLAAAEEQYDAGLRKLTATAKQIAALQRQVRGSQRAGDRLRADLRELPSRDALALRAQAAAKAASAHAQASSLEATLWRLAKKGVY